MNSMTVAQLKIIANDMDLTVPSKARKAEIIDLITAEVDRIHGEYIDEMAEISGALDALYAEHAEDENRHIVDEVAHTLNLKTTVTDYKLSRVEGFKTLAGKVNAYMRFNGTDKLTPAQWRRVRKAMRKHAVTSIDMGPFYVFPY